jgi:hypothetical protein
VASKNMILELGGEKRLNETLKVCFENACKFFSFPMPDTLNNYLNKVQSVM